MGVVYGCGLVLELDWFFLIVGVRWCNSFMLVVGVLKLCMLYWFLCLLILFVCCLWLG